MRSVYFYYISYNLKGVEDEKKYFGFINDNSSVWLCKIRDCENK